MNQINTLPATDQAPYYLPLADEVEVFEAAYASRLPILLKGLDGFARLDGLIGHGLAWITVYIYSIRRAALCLCQRQHHEQIAALVTLVLGRRLRYEACIAIHS